MPHVEPEVGAALWGFRRFIVTQARQEREIRVAVDSYGGGTLAAEPPFDFLQTD
jgi:hypothetical protein